MNDWKYDVWKHWPAQCYTETSANGYLGLSGTRTKAKQPTPGRLAQLRGQKKCTRSATVHCCAQKSCPEVGLEEVDV